MSQYALTVPASIADLAYDATVENVDAIVDDILEEGNQVTIVLTCNLDPEQIAIELFQYISPDFTIIESVY
jgi:hypothetical protein